MSSKEQGHYQGHAGKGGIQQHSVGDAYPYIVFGQGDAIRTFYGVMRDTGEIVDHAFHSIGDACKLALQHKHALDLHAARVTHARSVIEATLTNGGHKVQS